MNKQPTLAESLLGKLNVAESRVRDARTAVGGSHQVNAAFDALLDMMRVLVLGVQASGVQASQAPQAPPAEKP